MTEVLIGHNAIADEADLNQLLESIWTEPKVAESSGDDLAQIFDQYLLY